MTELGDNDSQESATKTRNFKDIMNPSQLKQNSETNHTPHTIRTEMFTSSSSPNVTLGI